MHFVTRALNFKHNRTSLTWALQETRDYFHLRCPFQIQSSAPFSAGGGCFMRNYTIKKEKECFTAGWVCLQWRQSGTKWDNRFLRHSDHVQGGKEWLNRTCGYLKERKKKHPLCLSCFGVTLWYFTVGLLVLVCSCGWGLNGVPSWVTAIIFIIPLHKYQWGCSYIVPRLISFCIRQLAKKKIHKNRHVLAIYPVYILFIFCCITESHNNVGERLLWRQRAHFVL